MCCSSRRPTSWSGSRRCCRWRSSGLVLLLVCTNLASFPLARAVDPREEIPVRLAPGAYLLATGNLPLRIPVALDLRLDANVLAFTYGVSLLAGALCQPVAPHLRGPSSPRQDSRPASPHLNVPPQRVPDAQPSLRAKATQQSVTRYHVTRSHFW